MPRQQFGTAEIAVVIACFSIPAIFILVIHGWEIAYFSPLKNSGNGQLWFVLIFGELFYWIASIVRGK